MQRLCVQNGLVSEFHQEKKLEMKKVFIRTFTGLFIVIAVYAIVFLSKYPFVTEAATALLSIAAVYEIFRATGENKKKAPLFISLVVAAIISFAPIPHYEVFACVTLIVAIFVFAAMMRKMETFRFYRTRQSVVMALIVVLLIRAIPTLRAVENGCLYLAFTITICFLSDILAYFTGKIFGTHQLAPRVSPKKTVEGALGGIVFTTVLVIGVAVLMERNTEIIFQLKPLALWSVLAVIVGQFGDLSMSVIKRICGIKDYGKIFPGHGGVLDRFDSHIFAIAFTLIFCTFGRGFIG